MILADRQAAALAVLRRRTAAAPQRFPCETRPSGSLPDDPDLAEAYLASTRWLDIDSVDRDGTQS